MNILIDINHPAQVHYFKILHQELRNRDHNVYVTTKEVPLTTALLSAYRIPYISYGKKSHTIYGKAFNQLRYNIKCLRLLGKHKIDIAFGTSASNLHAATFTKTKSIMTTDDDLAATPLNSKFVIPFADYIMTPDVLSYQKLKNKICYPGYQELAYLHPRRFRLDKSVLEKCGIKKGETYFILRFTAFKAHHDIGMDGLSYNQKWKLVRLLENHGKVFITSEVSDSEFDKYAIKIAPEKLHSLLFNASMLICDSQTMTTEAAVLGTPAFRCNTFAGKLTVIEEIEKLYELAYSFHPRHFDWMLERIKETLKIKNLKEVWKHKRDRMLKDKIDVTGFWVWFLENFPGSVEEVKREGFSFERFK